MENITTEKFCRKFGACSSGRRFALKYQTMRECYAALLAGEAGILSAEWAIWTATRRGVMSGQALRLFAVKCARRVQRLMEDERSIDALDVAERYAKGEATKEELKAARIAADTAENASDAAVWAATQVAAVNACLAAENVAYASVDAACADAVSVRLAAGSAPYAAVSVAGDAAYAAERKAQLEILREFGNPFKEGEENDPVLGLLRETGNPFKGEKKIMGTR